MSYGVRSLYSVGRWMRSSAVMRVNASCYSVKMGSLSLVWRGRSTLESLAPAMRTGTQDVACWPQPLVRTRWSWWVWWLKNWVYCWCTYHDHHACRILWPIGFLCIRVMGDEGSWPRLMALVAESSKYSIYPKFEFSHCSFSPFHEMWCRATHFTHWHVTKWHQMTFCVEYMVKVSALWEAEWAESCKEHNCWEADYISLICQSWFADG